MTHASTPHARPGKPVRAWRGFTRWRRTRPFWGGLFLLLAGVEIFLSERPQLPTAARQVLENATTSQALEDLSNG